MLSWQYFLAIIAKVDGNAQGINAICWFSAYFARVWVIFYHAQSATDNKYCKEEDWDDDIADIDE